MLVRCGFEGCKNRATCPGFSNYCKKHGGRYRCTHQDCCRFAQGRGLCIKHGYNKRRCNIDGCNNQSVMQGLCKKHGPTKQDSAKSSTVTVDIDLVRYLVMDYLGMNNWEEVHRFSAVCKSWQHSCLPYLSQIGIAPMDGGEYRKLNVPAFLSYLESEKFYHVQCIYIPCGKAKGLYVDEIRNVCPNVLTIVHSNWLMFNGRVEEVMEGTTRHQCYRVYRHDKDFTEGVNVWVKWIWDKKYKFVAESQFVTPSSHPRRSRMRTSFLRY
jgi:hypothetical protein